MKKLTFILSLIVLFSCSSTKNHNIDLDKYPFGQKIVTREYDFDKIHDYENLKIRALTLDTALDFFYLRLSFLQNKDYYINLTFRDLKERAFEALEEEDFETVINLGKEALEYCFVDMDIHYLLAIAYEHFGFYQDFGTHLFIYKQLVKSILTSGDGRTPETAYVVINIAEIYSLLRFFGLKFKSQELIYQNWKPYDIIEVYNREEDIYENIYFDVSLTFKR